MIFKRDYKKRRFDFLSNKFDTNKEEIESALDSFYGTNRNTNIIMYSDYAVKNALLHIKNNKK